MVLGAAKNSKQSNINNNNTLVYANYIIESWISTVFFANQRAKCALFLKNRR